MAVGQASAAAAAAASSASAAGAAAAPIVGSTLTPGGYGAPVVPSGYGLTPTCVPLYCNHSAADSNGLKN